MLQEEEKKLRAEMHDACEKSGVALYTQEEEDIASTSDDIIDTEDNIIDENCSADKEQIYLDQNVCEDSYSDIRDWVEGVVDGFKKGMEFDGLVDRKRNIRCAVAMFIKASKGQYIYSSNNSRKHAKVVNSFKPCYRGR